MTEADNKTKTSVFAFDIRSMALFRIALGILLIADLIYRLPTLVELYTDDGWYTRQFSFEYYQREYGGLWNYFIWSLYWISGSPTFVRLLFVASVVFAVLLTVGKWTRLATIGCWALWISLQVRNPLVITSGDFLLKMVLFWSIFLPLGATWSVDAARRSAAGRPFGYPGKSFVSLATVGFLIQLIASYLFPGIAKLNEIWFRGEAMAYVLRLDIYITEFGRSLLANDTLLAFTSWATVFAEAIWILTLLVPFKNDWFRWSNLIVFWSFHIGIGLAMSIGLFPVISMVAWLPLLPSSFWNRFSGSPAATHVSRFDSPLRFSGTKLSFKLSQFICGIFCFVVVGWNIANIESLKLLPMRNTLLAPVAYPLAMDQYFQMFGKPPNQNPWFVYEATLKNGESIDIFRDQPVDHARPEWVRKSFPGFHWRKIHRNLLDKRLEFLRESLLAHAVKRWNEQHEEQEHVVRAVLTCYLEDIGPDYSPINLRSSVWGVYVDKDKGPGSVFDSMLDKELDSPF